MAKSNKTQNSYHLISPDGVVLENLVAGTSFSSVPDFLKSVNEDLIEQVAYSLMKEKNTNNIEEISKQELKQRVLDTRRDFANTNNIFEYAGSVLNDPGKVFVYKNLSAKEPKIYDTLEKYAIEFVKNYNSFDNSKLPDELRKLNYSFRGGRLAKTMPGADEHVVSHNLEEYEDDNVTYNNTSELSYEEQVKKYTRKIDVPSIINSGKYVPASDVVIKPIVWKTLVRNVLRNESSLLVGESGVGKTTIVMELARVLERPFFKFNLGASQEPRSYLIGNTQIKPDVGTYVSESEFVRAISTPGAIILLDEISRANPEAWNILMSVLDPIQKYLRIDESDDSKVVRVAPGVSFIGTANIGANYTSTRIMDWALMERMMRINIDFLNEQEEVSLLKQRYPDCPTNWITALARTACQTRTEIANNASTKLSRAISTRVNLRLASLLADGFNYEDALDIILYPMFDPDGGTESERTYVQQIAQAHIPGTPVYDTN